MKNSCLFFAVALSIAEAHAAKPNLDANQLLRNAIPINDRALEYEGLFQITGDYSIEFSHCQSLKMEADEDSMFTQETYDLTENGQLLMQQSYVLFNVCKTQDCGTRYAKERLYMTSLSNYMTALLPASSGGDNEVFCEGCNAWCVAEVNEDEANDGDQDANDEEDSDEEGDEVNDRRRTNEIVYLDCGNCEEHGCYSDDGDDADSGNDITDAEAVEWAQTIAGCAATGQQWLGFDLYAGFMCNAKGSGAEIAIFLDPECTMYTNLKSALNILEETGSDEYIYKAYYPIVYPFQESISCAVPVYYPPQGSGYNYEGDGDQGEISPLCESLFVEGSYYPLSTCGVQSSSSSSTRSSAVTNDEDVDSIEIAQANYTFYTYVLSYEDSLYEQSACQVIQSMDGDYCLAPQTYKVNWSGEFFEFENNKGVNCRLKQIGQGIKTAMKTLGTIFLAGLSAAGLVALAQTIAKSRKLSRDRHAKTEGLMPQSNGAVA